MPRTSCDALAGAIAVAARGRGVAHAVVAGSAVDVGEAVGLAERRLLRLRPLRSSRRGRLSKTCFSSSRRAGRPSRSARRRGRRGPRRSRRSCHTPGRHGDLDRPAAARVEAGPRGQAADDDDGSDEALLRRRRRPEAERVGERARRRHGLSEAPWSAGICAATTSAEPIESSTAAAGAGRQPGDRRRPRASRRSEVISDPITACPASRRPGG